VIHKAKITDEGSKTPSSLDSLTLKAAKKIYKTYCQLHSQLTRYPLGVAINCNTHRGQLIFKKRPILLPGECFVPLNQLESEVSLS
jgi:hypothetical protein